MSRVLLAICLCVYLAACGGGGGDASSQSQPQVAAQVLAGAIGRVASPTAIDPAFFSKRQAQAEQAAANVPASTVALFDFGEANYRIYFPSRQSDRMVGGFAYRFYPETGAYLIVDESSRIYVMGGPFGAEVTLVGVVSEFLPVCKSIVAGFDLTKLEVPPEVAPGGGGGGDGGGDGGGAGGGSGEGAIRGADVSLYDGSGQLLGTAVSDEHGLVRLKACGATGPFLIEFAGNNRAQYFDEAVALRENSDANAWISFPGGEKLSAYVENLTDHHVVVTVMTHVAAQQVQQETAGASADRAKALKAGDVRRRAVRAVTASAVQAANLKARDTFNRRFVGSGISIDDVTKMPALAYSLESLRSFGTDPRGQYAQMLTSLAKSAAQFNPTLPNPAREMTRQLTRDLSDGEIDGKDKNGAQVAPTSTRAYEPTQLSNSVVQQSAGRLNLQVAGPGSVTVTSATAAAVACGNGDGLCYPFGTVVTLLAQPAAGSTFQGWTGCIGTSPTASCAVTMSGDKKVSASFSAADTPKVQLRVTVSGGGGSVSSQPTGIACPSDCSEDYAAGTVVTLRATAGAGATFTGWSDPACPGTGPCVLTMSAARSVTATFAGEALLNVSRSGDGSGNVNSTNADISCGSTCSKSYPLGTQVTLSATPASGSVFAGWSGACSGLGSCTVTMDTAKSVTALFNTLSSFSLNVTVTGSGSVGSSPSGINNCISGTCTASFVAGTTVSMLASPVTGQTFLGWSGDCSGVGVCTVTLSAARNVTAIFSSAVAPGTLTVTRAGSGSGLVTSTTGDINCGAVCSKAYALTAQVTLVASPAAGSTFAGWSGACTGLGNCTLSMSAARTVVATFSASSPTTYTLSVAVNGQGRVSSSPAGISNCTGVCSATFAIGTVVRLDAVANTIQCVTTPCPSPVFTGWSGDCTGTGACNVTMSASRQVTANFGTSSSYALSVAVSGGGVVNANYTSYRVQARVTTTCTNDGGCLLDATAGTTATLTAVPNAGSTFTGWTGACSGSINPCVVSMDAAKSVTATFSSATGGSYTLAVTVTGPGTVTLSPAPATSSVCSGSTCTATFAAGTAVSLQATPDASCQAIGCPVISFSGWTGACSGTGGCSLLMSANRQVTATFTSVVTATEVVLGASNTTVTAGFGSERFVFDYKIVNGRATKVSGLATINGFSRSADTLVFRNVSGGALLSRAQFLALPGLSVSENPFNSTTNISFDPDAGTAGGITLTGILDASLSTINIETR